MRSLLLTISRRWLLLFVLLTSCLYFWQSGRQYAKWVVPEPGGYNGGYAKALVGGHTYFKKAPPEMAKLADPYDPAQYLPYYTFDLSYYKGAIYSYFGVAPALVLYVPWTVLTGTYLSEQFGVALFMSLGFAVSVGLLAALRRRYFSNAPEWALVLSVLVLAIGSNTLLLFWPPYYSQVVQSCARLLQISSLAALFLALQSQRRAKICLAAASVCAGLMVVARPSFFPAIFLLVPPWWIVTRRTLAEPGASRTAWIPPFLAALIPISCVGAGLMMFNYARFDSPLEFGTSYQQFGQDLREIVQMSPEYLVKNALQSLFFIPTFTRYFPFMLYQSEPIGALALFPFSWMALLLFFGWRVQKTDRSATGALALSLLIAPVGNLLMLACYYLAWVRHHVDVVLPMSFAAAAGLVAGAHAWAPFPARRKLLAIAASLLVAVNIWTTVSFSFTFPGQPELPWLTRLFNTPVYLWEKISGAPFTDTRTFDVTFPSNRAGFGEALLTTGTADSDIVYVRYLASDQLVLGFFHTQLGAIETNPLTVVPGSSHRLEITLGSLCPPPGHPVFSGWTLAAIERAQRQLRLSFDGQAVLDQDMRFHPSSPGNVLIGRAPTVFAYQAFTGTLTPLKPAALALHPPRLAAWPGTGLQLDVQLTNRRLGRSDPIFSLGRRDAGDLLFVVYPDATHIQLGWDHGLAGHYVSPLLDAPDDGRVHRITISVEPAGSTAPAVGVAPASPATPARTRVRFDNSVALEIPTAPYAAPVESACFGVQSFPAATEPVFGGRILSVAPLSSATSQ